MPNWSSLTVYKKNSGRLAESAERDFERAVIPFLRVIWPSLQQARPRKEWDQKGIDLFTWSDEGSFECVVQCKGYIVRELRRKQLYEARKSINSFKDSGEKAKNYIFLHNRDRRWRDFHSEIEEELSALVTSGIVETAELWSRREMLFKVFDAMRRKLDTLLRQSASDILERFHSTFRLSLPYVPVVPVTENELVFRRLEPCKKETVKPCSLRNVRNFLKSPTVARWTLFVGVFGAGKTTAALNAAITSNLNPIFIQVASLSSKELRSGTYLLLENIVKSLELFKDIEDRDYIFQEEIAGAVLGYLLRRPQSDYLLVMDGLDENRAYAKLDGLQYLNNQLAEFACPVILTTRKEHLGEIFGDFSLAFYEFSSKHSPKRSARLLELEEWSESNVADVVKPLMGTIGSSERKNLAKFLRLIENKEYLAIYGKLPLNPLFLNFILEDVIENGIQERGRTGFIRSWVKRKIRRDRLAPKRSTICEGMDTEEFVANMLELLKRIAAEMFEHDGNNYVLVEFIDSGKLKTLTMDVFNEEVDSVLAILLNSVLVPKEYRHGRKLHLFFAFRVLQEFFLASFLFDRIRSVEFYPKSDVVK
jgi:hypothetical protein